MNTTEVDRLACLACSMRPDWPMQSTQTYLRRTVPQHPERAYGDIAHALLEIALDPKTQNPGRLWETGPWWHARPGSETPRPVTSGPEARFCGYEMATEDGQPRRCGRLVVPGEAPCDHGLAPRPNRDTTVAALRQTLANTRGVHERAEVGAEERRKGAGNG